MYFIYLHFFPDIDEIAYSDCITQQPGHLWKKKSHKHLIKPLSFWQNNKIVLNLKCFAENGVLLNQSFPKCKLFNSINCRPPDFCRLIWTETQLKAFQILPIASCFVSCASGSWDPDLELILNILNHNFPLKKTDVCTYSLEFFIIWNSIILNQSY